MSTRSLICQKTHKGIIHSVYCHYDGYIDGVGKTLKGYYNSPLKVKKLVNKGAISTLNKNREGGLPIEFGSIRVREGNAFKFPKLCDDSEFNRVMNERYGELDYRHRMIRMEQDWCNNTRYYNLVDYQTKIHNSLDSFLTDKDHLFNIEFIYMYNLKTKVWEYIDVCNADGELNFKLL